MSLANVSLTNTFDEWRIRTNQLVTEVNKVVDVDLISVGVTANAGFLTANTAYNKANAANVLAQSAYDLASLVSANNTPALSLNIAQTAFAFANTVNIKTDLAYNKTNAAIITANTGYDKANAANVLAQSAYDLASLAVANNTPALSLNIAQTAFGFANTTNIKADLAFDKANAANLLAYNTGIGVNAFISSTITGANTSVGTGANAYATLIGTSGNTYFLATLSGANTAVGAAANNFARATIAGANTAVGAGANAYAATVGTSANTVAIAAFAKANTIGTLGTQPASSASITGGTIIGITDLAVADGGTGSSTAAGARTNLGAAGTEVVNSFTQRQEISSLDSSNWTLYVYSPSYGIAVTGANTQYPTGLHIPATTHATSERAAALLGDWYVGQDSAGNGTKDFYIYDAFAGQTRLSINTSGITWLQGLVLNTDLAVADGGTGSSTAAGARTNLGLGTMSTQSSSSVSITGGSVTGLTTLGTTGGTISSMAYQSSSSVSITGGTISGVTVDATSVDGKSFGTFTAAGGVGYATSTTAMSATAAGTSGEVLTSGGPGGVPTWTSQSSLSVGNSTQVGGYTQSEIATRGLDVGGSSVGTGTTAAFQWSSWGGPNPNYMIFTFRNVSHSSGTAQALQIEFYDSVAAGYVSTSTISASVSASAALSGSVTIYRPTSATVTKHVTYSSGTAGGGTNSLSGGFEISGSGTLSRLRISWTSGASFDSGAVYVYAAS